MPIAVVDGPTHVSRQVSQAELQLRYARVLEGSCPHGHGPLLVRLVGDRWCGWCFRCGAGWSVRGIWVTMHFERIVRLGSVDLPAARPEVILRA